MTLSASEKDTRVMSLRAARLAVVTMFFVNGAAFANWAPRIPTVQQRLDLSTGALGLALLGMPVGSILTMPLTGWLIARWGSRPVVRAAALLFCAALPLPALAPNPLLLFLALVVFGAGSGSMDVAMNAQGIAVERLYGRPIMSSFHGMYSLGGLAGAAVAGIVVTFGVDIVPHLLVAALVLCVAAALASLWLLPSSVDVADEGMTFFAWPTPALLGLGIVAFCSMLGEGAMADWSAVYLHRTLAASAGLAAAGYAAFSLTMAAGRFVGDWINQHVGPVMVLRLGGALAAIGLGVSLILAFPAIALVGFACVGAGLSSIVPIAFSAAGHTPGMASGTALAAVSTTGYLGFLVGPPVIGFAAGVLTLRGSLGFVVLLCLLIVLLAPSVRHKDVTPPPR